MLNNKELTIFGMNWPEVDGVAYIYHGLRREYAVKTMYSATSIFDWLRHYPDSQCILIIQPHEQAYFLYRLTQAFSRAQIKIVTDKLFLSDRVILNALGFTDVTTFDAFIHHCEEALSPVRPIQFTHLPDWDEAGFLTFINKTILHKLNDWGVTEKQKKVLSYAVKGESNFTIGRRLKISNKTISSHKINGLKKLPHGEHHFAIVKGLRVQYPATCRL